jgi:sporulation protein YlmC with PRC-barrel domain
MPQILAADRNDRNDATRSNPSISDRARVDLDRSLSDRTLNLVKASDVIGMTLRNSQDQDIGKIDDLAVSLHRGRVYGVLVGSGGLLGLGEKAYFVPPSAIHIDTAAKRAHLDVTKDQLKAAPEYRRERGQERGTYTMAEISQGCDYFKSNIAGQNARGEAHQLNNDKDKTDVQIESANKLIGKRVENERGEKLGSIENLMVDVPAGRLAHVVLSSGGFLGIGDELSVVPPTAFRMDSGRDALRLDVTKEMLTSAPHFKSSDWPNLGEPTYMERVYKSYGVKSYYDTNSVDADNTRLNVRDRDASEVTSGDQGNSKSDIDLAASIRKQIVKRDDLSVNAHNVKVIVRDGRVTLRGPVNSDDEKRAIAEIARNAAGNNNVDDRLDIKRDTDNDRNDNK